MLLCSLLVGALQRRLYPVSKQVIVKVADEWITYSLPCPFYSIPYRKGVVQNAPWMAFPILLNWQHFNLTETVQNHAKEDLVFLEHSPPAKPRFEIDLWHELKHLGHIKNPIRTWTVFSRSKGGNNDWIFFFLTIVRRKYWLHISPSLFQSQFSWFRDYLHYNELRTIYCKTNLIPLCLFERQRYFF